MRAAPAALAAFGLLAALEAPRAGPLDAPSGTHPIVADFVVVCSRALDAIAEGGLEATRRGWLSDAGGALGAIAMAAGGLMMMEKEADGLSASLTVSTAPYPHLLVRHCMMTVKGGDLESIDVAPIWRTEGVKGALRTIGGPVVGLASAMDADGRVTTINVNQISGTLVMQMARSERTALGRGEGLAGAE